MTRVFDHEPEDPQHDRVPDDQPGHALGMTSRRTILVATLAGGVLGWMLVRTLELAHQVVPVTPWTMSLMMALVAVAAVVVANWMRQQLAGPRAAVSNERAVSALVLGKAMLLTGAALAGGHFAYVLTQAGHWDVPLPRRRVIFGTVAIVASILFAGAGRLLEHSCRVPADPDEDAGA